jgi:hypothetical protein
MSKIADLESEHEDKFHWLSAMCYMERLAPTELIVDADFERQLNEELDQLRELNPLEALALCLKIVCHFEEY